MKTVDIKGKPYVEVNTRVLYFRDNYPTGNIITEIVSIEDGVCIMKALIVVDDKVRAVGHAYEKEGSTFINKTSYIENCETSAVGRALGLFGIGIDTNIASSDEVVNAIENQKPKKPERVTSDEFDNMVKFAEQKEITYELLEEFTKKKFKCGFTKIKREQYDQLYDYLKTK